MVPSAFTTTAVAVARVNARFALISDAETSCRFRISQQRIAAFFGSPPERAVFDNAQALDRDGLIGRLFSSSYMPPRDHPRHADARADASAVFDRWQQGGAVTLRYETIAFAGALA
jgi:hypothetical protein